MKHIKKIFAILLTSSMIALSISWLILCDDFTKALIQYLIGL